MSSQPTEQDWHPSSLLAHDALDSISNAKFTAQAGTDFYDRSPMSRRYALAGVACSSIVSCCCIIAGTVIISARGPSGMIQATATDLQIEMRNLALNLIVTLCTESIGFVHGISLRSALASQSRLTFNTNLRLLTAAHGWRNPNGALLNGLMAVLLIISYTSVSLAASALYIVGLPLLVLGIALLLQIAIALAGMQTVKILTWSSSPFDLTAALVYHTQLAPASFRCMRGVSDLYIAGGSARPSDAQPSAWHAHTSIRKVVVSLWGLVVVCAGWAARPRYRGRFFFTDVQTTYALEYRVTSSKGFNAQTWILAFVNIAVIQGVLTLGLHCSELIADVIQNERQWRCATTRKGLHTATNPLKGFLTNPLGLVLFIVKPVLHWMFGIAFQATYVIDIQYHPFTVMGSYTKMGVYQIVNLCIALFIFSCVFTIIALHQPRGPQPATYGHLQTLANLVDEWSPVMWWGHKEDGIPYCHAGTSNHPLPDVKMDCVYAGTDVMSYSPISGEVPAVEKAFLN
ncbi:uncharacterized protein EDB91DRAFT_1309967 [Suillus paluster]|uniref:uncharacterized protein n=1 Tax=Suillus paluster TaxID=48578 RepID=UPI001B863387|nr:uncharacterized protein EDB91DRAFT_1309967 [Suillus paluster]KAG1730555.1 hypothetical protein EDB91DRAFT_1309967 [Suillus paluster]